MPTTVRLTKKEEKQLNEKCIEVNKELIKNNQMPVRESELVHRILEATIHRLKVNKNGELIFLDK